MTFLNLMRNKLKPKEVNDALLGIENRLPPDYSVSDEVNTGLKWINGKNIYMRTYTGTVIEGGTVLEESFTDTLLDASGFCYDEVNGIQYPTPLFRANTLFLIPKVENGALSLTSGTTITGFKFQITFHYIKANPEPEPTTTTKVNKNK